LVQIADKGQLAPMAAIMTAIMIGMSGPLAFLLASQGAMSA
jgi:hypothetical protein